MSEREEEEPGEDREPERPRRRHRLSPAGLWRRRRRGGRRGDTVEPWRWTTVEMNSCMKETERISIHPLQLDFSFRPNKLIACPIDVTNNMGDRHVTVRFVQKFLDGRSYYTNLSKLKCVVPPKSTNTFVVMMEKQQQPPDNMDVLAIVVQSVPDNGWADSDNDRDLHEVTLSAVCATTREMMTSETIRRAVKIISDEDSVRSINSMDAHPTEPWVLAGNYDGYASIWNYETQARVVNLKINCRHVVSVRFIARKQLFVVGDDHGYIHVYTCMTMKELHTFKAHKDSVNSLAVHPTQPLVLSASSDTLIKLWNWDEDWECIRTFNGHSKWVHEVKFNPHDTYTFASASGDRTAKIWSIFSPDPVTTLDCPETQCGVDYYPTGGDRMHYMVTTSWDGTARIWDLQTETCVREFKGPHTKYRHNTSVIDCLRGHQLLVTVSHDHGVSLCDSTTYRIESTVHFGLGRVRRYAYINRIRRLQVYVHSPTVHFAESSPAAAYHPPAIPCNLSAADGSSDHERWRCRLRRACSDGNLSALSGRAGDYHRAIPLEAIQSRDGCRDEEENYDDEDAEQETCFGVFGGGSTYTAQEHPLFLTRVLGIDRLGSGLLSGKDDGGGAGGGYLVASDSGGDPSGIHYKKLIEEDPCNGLFLRNYAQFLYQVKGDRRRAEEYYSRAILADPDDGELLSEYAKLVWEVHRDDEDRASSYFDRAARASPHNSHVLAAQAAFLWDTEDDGGAGPEGAMSYTGFATAARSSMASATS